jgi:hypothetical protein
MRDILVSRTDIYGFSITILWAFLEGLEVEDEKDNCCGFFGDACIHCLRRDSDGSCAEFRRLRA